jgi:Xaa-Pro aminopeptidase
MEATMTTFQLADVQAAIRQFQFDGWLLVDFRGGNTLANRVLQRPADAHATRRWAYFIPASGKPRKLVHRIEAGALDHLPGEKTVYLRWQEWEAGIAAMVSGVDRVAMEFSPRNGNPYVARVDAGTVDLVRSFETEVASSGDLVQLFESTWDDAQWAMHKQAEKLVDDGFALAWRLIAEHTAGGGSIRETQVQTAIMNHFRACGLTTDHPPCVAVGPNSGRPHYSPTIGDDREIRAGDFVLVDAWAKLDQPRAVYADYTRVAFVGSEVPEKYVKIFNIVAASRDAAIERVKTAFTQKQPLQGYQVDDAARAVIDKAGYGPQFYHRTGHNIGQETHGNGAHMDNIETHEERRVLPRTCFSVEPGIYLEEFGVRTEVNVYVDKESTVHVTGEVQREIRCLT